MSLGRKTKIDGPPDGHHLKQNELRADPLGSVLRTAEALKLSGSTLGGFTVSEVKAKTV